MLCHGPPWKEEMVSVPWLRYKESEKYHKGADTEAKLWKMDGLQIYGI
jgi:hypothetical protein